MNQDSIVVDEETEVSERDVLIGIRTQIADTEIEIAAIETYKVKSQRQYLGQLHGRLKSLKTQFHVYKSLWK